MGAFRMKLWCVQAFSAYFHKMADSSAILIFPIFAKNDRVRPIWVISGCVKYEFDMGNGVSYVWSKPWRAAVET